MALTKKCCKCKEDKPLTAFYKRPKRKNSLSAACSKCLCAYGKVWYRSNPEKVRAWRERYKVEKRDALDDHWYRTAYGISLAEYNTMDEAQHGRCAICGEPETDTHSITKRVKRLSVDHDSATGAIRGLLCAKCNRGIGMLKHDVRVLRVAIAYLERHNGTH